MRILSNNTTLNYLNSQKALVHFKNLSKWNKSLYTTSASWEKSYKKLKSGSWTFQYFFENQCTLLNNGIGLSNNTAELTKKLLVSVTFSTEDSVLSNNLPKLTNKLLDSVTFSTKTFCAHSHDMLSIQTIKLYGNSICKPLLII